MNLLDALIEDELLLPPVLVGSEQHREIWIAIRTDGASGDGTRKNPYNGSSALLFDELMSSSRITTNMTIHLGPGIFQTKGGDGNGFAGSWRPRNGQRIVGSGMHATTLQMIDAGTAPNSQGHGQTIVGSGSSFPVNNFEISDLTLDCNFARQINPYHAPSDPEPPYNNVMLAGISIAGRNNRVRRVRVINFGTGTGLECFPIYLVPWVFDDTQRGNLVLEDCILELPNENNGRETTCLSCYGDSTETGAGAITRNCYVNCEFANPQYPEHNVVAVKVNASTVELTLQWPHCLQKYDIVSVSGSLLGTGIRFTLDGNPSDPSPTPANNPIAANNCGQVETFSNRELDSTLLPGYKPLEGRHTEEWELEAENLLML